MQRYFVYILSNYTRTVFYIGMTKDLRRRLLAHRSGNGAGFAQKYNIDYLVHWEEFAEYRMALRREKQLKTWHRDWKLRLIRSRNPEMKDLSAQILCR